MAVYAHGSRSTVVGTAARSMLSLYATAGITPKIMEIGVFNTTATPICVAVQRFTNATNVGAGLAENGEDDVLQVPLATMFAGHTGDGGVGGIHRQASLGGAVGSGVIWTFPSGLVIPVGTANGVGVTTPTGTGQICDIYYVWTE